MYPGQGIWPADYLEVNSRRAGATTERWVPFDEMLRCLRVVLVSRGPRWERRSRADRFETVVSGLANRESGAAAHK